VDNACKQRQDKLGGLRRYKERLADTLLGALAGGTGFDAPVILLMSENVRRKDDMPLICCGDGVVATMRTAADWDRETGRFANVRQKI